MRILLTIAALLVLAAPVAAEIDLMVQSVGIDDAGGGLSDVVVVIDMRSHGPLSANTTDVTLRLDGIFHDQIIINYGLYVAPGCTYTADYMGGGPACLDVPGCDLWSINGSSIPGNCVLVIPGGVVLSCWCSHPWIAIFQGVSLAGVSLLEVIMDEGETCEEYWEDNNVFTIESPVQASLRPWGAIKGLYR